MMPIFDRSIESIELRTPWAVEDSVGLDQDREEVAVAYPDSGCSYMSLDSSGSLTAECGQTGLPSYMVDALRNALANTSGSFFAASEVDLSLLLAQTRSNQDWEAFFRKIDGLADLSVDWDENGGEAVEPGAINFAKEVASFAREVGAMPNWVLPTSDGTILLQISLADGRTLKWEVGGKGEMGVAEIAPDGSKRFHDADVRSFSQFFDRPRYEQVAVQPCV